MRHLKPHEFAELLDGQLAEPRAAHAGECGRCRAEAERLRDVLQRASAIDVPEPSPLFWDHFASRVHDTIEGIAPDSTGHASWLRRPAGAWALSALLATVVLALTFGRALLPGGTVPVPSESPQVATTGARETPPATAASSPIENDIEADGAWALVRIVADDVAWEDQEAAGLDAVPGTVERLALELTEAERVELARLLEHELKPNGV